MTRDYILTLVGENLQDAQEKMKYYADQKRTNREFIIRDWVYLRLYVY